MKLFLGSLLLVSAVFTQPTHALPVSDCPNAMTLVLSGFSAVAIEDSTPGREAVQGRLLHDRQLRIELERDLSRRQGGRCFYAGPNGADAAIATRTGRNFLVFSVSDYVNVNGNSESVSGVLLIGSVTPDHIELTRPATQLGVSDNTDSDRGSWSPTIPVVRVRQVAIQVAI